MVNQVLPPKGTGKSCVDKPAILMANAQRGYFKKGQFKKMSCVSSKVGKKGFKVCREIPFSSLKMKMILLRKGKGKEPKSWRVA
jgi:hypothetical protein